MNKSELELQNLGKIIGAMPADENRVCVNMIASLLASLGDPETGKTFMIAIAYVNTQCAVSAIAMGLVKPDGSAGTPDETPDELAKMGQNAKLHGKMAMGGLTTAKPFDTLVEKRAQEIYESWHAKEGFVKWVPRGNSVMQDEARQQARKQFSTPEPVSVGNLQRNPIGPGAKPRRKQMWPQYGMTRERYMDLMSRDTKELLTRDEIKAGWFYDDEYDGLLANHAWEGHQ